MTVIYSYILFYLGFFFLIFNSKRLLIIFLRLELMVLGVFNMIIQRIRIIIYEITIFFFVIVVIEACVSLCLIVRIINFYGSDEVNNYVLINS